MAVSEREQVVAPPTTLAVKRLLSQPPCRAGMRLRPEEELVRVLQLGRRQVRKILGELEAEGIVVRRKGSGTYLRQVPGPAGNDDPNGREALLSLRAHDLLVSPDSESQHATRGRAMLRPTRGQRCFHLELWSDLHCTSVPNQFVLAGLAHRAGRLGHQLTIHSLVERENVPLSYDEIARQLSDSHADGYLVGDRWSDLFMEALGKRAVPVISFDTGVNPIHHEPLLRLDTAEAVERAVRLFAESGYRRIALLDMEGPAHANEPLREAYDRAMSQAGLPCRAVETALPQFNAALAAFRRLVSKPEQPEAVYVSDDFLLAGVAEGMSVAGLRPGEDMGIITLSNVGMPLPDGPIWSRMEFNPKLLGGRLVDEIVRRLEEAGAERATMSIHATWQPGETHLPRVHPLAGGDMPAQSSAGGSKVAV